MNNSSWRCRDLHRGRRHDRRGVATRLTARLRSSKDRPESAEDIVPDLPLTDTTVVKDASAAPRRETAAGRPPIEDRAILEQFARTKFIPAKNADYAPIEEVGKVTNLLN